MKQKEKFAICKKIITRSIATIKDEIKINERSFWKDHAMEMIRSFDVLDLLLEINFTYKKKTRRQKAKKLIFKNQTWDIRFMERYHKNSKRHAMKDVKVMYKALKEKIEEVF